MSLCIFATKTVFIFLSRVRNQGGESLFPLEALQRARSSLGSGGACCLPLGTRVTLTAAPKCVLRTSRLPSGGTAARSAAGAGRGPAGRRARHPAHSPRPPAEGPASGSAARIIAALMPAAAAGGEAGGAGGREGVSGRRAALRPRPSPPAAGARTRRLALFVRRRGRAARSRREPRVHDVGRAQQQVPR